MASKPDRNDSCHCGSGKKFKHCCIGKGQSKSGTTSKAGLIGLIIVLLIGAWFLTTVLTSGGNAPECPAGKVWSEAHQHCH